jgi:CheY-like chemotaxis protein
MPRARNSATILVAEDDADDRFLIEEACRENHFASALRFVSDGEELMDYLRHRGRYAPPADAPRPALILLDLGMPKMDGRAALREIKSDPALRRIPVVVLTTSNAKDDIAQSYNAGANSYIIKPISSEETVDLFATLHKYWFEIVKGVPD